MDISKSIRRSNDLIEALDLQHTHRYVNGMNSDNEFSENENGIVPLSSVPYIDRNKIPLKPSI